MFIIKSKFFIIIIIISICNVNATFVGPSMAPVDRLIRNTENYIKKHPKDSHAYYTLARINYLAFIDKTNYVEVCEDKVPPEIAPDWLRRIFPDNFTFSTEAEALILVFEQKKYSSISKIPKKERKKLWKEVKQKAKELRKVKGPGCISQEQALIHAVNSVNNFKKAIKLKPTKGLYVFGLACLYKQYFDYHKKNKDREIPSEFKNITRQDITTLFLKAHELSIAKDLKNCLRSPLGVIYCSTANEAGIEYLKIIKLKNNLTEIDKKNIAKVKIGLKKLKNVRVANITPIIFTFEKHSTILDLLAVNHNVVFDLDGDGRKELWPWLKSNTGILVWDPENRKNITSGRQLFGNATWWLMFENGYDAMRALDDNGNNKLEATELRGIGVWFDKNSNGKSEPDEVFPIEQTEIKAISVVSQRTSDNILYNPAGIELRDGRVIPSYDWLTKPVK